MHQGAIDVLGRVTVPQSVHQAKFSMGTVLGLIAVHGKAGLPEFQQLALTDPTVSEFRGKVADATGRRSGCAYPRRWLGRVEVHTTDGRVLHGAIDSPKGDPDNTPVARRTGGQVPPLAGVFRRTEQRSGQAY